MCGFVGFYSPQKTFIPDLSLLKSAAASMASRGPDYQGLEYNRSLGIGLAHNRLSILDLSTAGNQPMADDRGNLIVLNGEIYNFVELRNRVQAQGWQFKSTSDTEVLLALHSSEAKQVPELLMGMFAYAYFDKANSSFFLARDRAGEKPLYYAFIDQTLVFGSTAEAVRRLLPRTTVNLDCARYMLAYDSIPSDRSIWTEIHKLPPGHVLKFDKHGLKQERYWPIDSAFEESHSIKSVSDNLKTLIDRSVQDMSISDVPLGVLLSGGVDSTLITQALRPRVRELHTFSIGFSEKSFDESPYANFAAEKLQTIHHHQTLNVGDVARDLDLAFRGLDEPMGDPSYLATWQLAKLARQHVTVALGGDGADELFWGYASMPFERLHPVVSLPFVKSPKFLIKLSKTFSATGSYMSLSYKIGQMLRGVGYETQTRHQLWISPSSPDKFFIPPYPVFPNRILSQNHWLEMTKFYFETYLPNSILAKSDRASMAHGLEVRAPFLHPNLIKFACQISNKNKLNGFKTKYVLRKLLQQDERLAALAFRKKHGFAIPVAKWLQQPEIANQMLASLRNNRDFISEVLNFKDFEPFIKNEFSHGIQYPKFLYNLLVLSKWHEHKHQPVSRITD